MLRVATTWRETLGDRVSDVLRDEIDSYEDHMHLVHRGELDEKLFMELRLRRGVYGQRYDNGKRHDGEKTQTIAFPCGDAVKGTLTVWDAPGMQRIKVPFGKLSAEQLEELAACAEEYSDGVLHVTTRQDIQLHFVHIADTPDMMRRLAAVGITTREACGNSIRNVTACPYAGVCRDQAFDVTGYADAVATFLLGHPDVQDFGRKFKIALSGCEDNPCALVRFHDLGAIAKTRTDANGVLERGFDLYVGGGLGSVPQQARLLYAFASPYELLPICQAVSRVFARLGEKQNRARARVKFLVSKLGIDAFRELVDEERKTLRPDPRHRELIDALSVHHEAPSRPPGELPPVRSAAFERWYADNAKPQAQEGYDTFVVKLPLGDFSGDQARALADLVRRYAGGSLRTTVEQNLALRWISRADAVEVFEALSAMGLAEAGALTITDITSCPGTDTCKLGISASRGLAGQLHTHLRVVEDELAPPIRALNIKASGCFNACGQHHAADIGFLGVSRNVAGRRVPHFQLVLGGEWAGNARSYGLAVGAIPSKRVPEVVDRLTADFLAAREGEESFQAYIQRIGKAAIRASLKELMEVPAYEADPSFYSDWGDPREYTIGDLGVGECAGAIVPFVEFGLKQGERQVFEAQVALDAGSLESAAQEALRGMLTVAQALTRHLGVEVTDEASDIAAQFRTHLYETKRFFDPFAGGKFAHYFFKAVESAGQTLEHEAVHQRVEEAQLFVEAGYACYDRLASESTAA